MHCTPRQIHKVLMAAGYDVPESSSTPALLRHAFATFVDAEVFSDISLEDIEDFSDEEILRGLQRYLRV